MFDFLFGTAIFDFLFGTARKPKAAVDTSHVVSPFPFLADLGADQVDLAHRTIVSQLSPEMKKDLIAVLVGSGKEAVSDYTEWHKRLGERVPHDVLELFDPEQREAVADLIHRHKFNDAVNLARKSSPRAGDRMKEFTKMVSPKTPCWKLIFGNATEILEQWKEQKEAEKSGDAPSRCSPNSTPTSNDLLAGFDFSNANFSSNVPPLFCWDSFDNLYVMQPNGKYELRDAGEYFNRGRASYSHSMAPAESLEKPADSYAHSKNTNATDFHNDQQQQAPLVSWKPFAPEHEQTPVEKPALFGKSVRSAAAQNKEDYFNKKYPKGMTEQEFWKELSNGEQPTFEDIALKSIIESVTLTENLDPSENFDEDLLRSYEHQFHEQLPKENDCQGFFISASDESTAIPQSPIRRSTEIENVSGRRDGEDWMAKNEADKKREKLPTRSSEAVLTSRQEGARMSRDRQRTPIRTTSRSRSPLRLLPSALVIRERSKSPLKPPLPAAPAPRKRSESPKFKATRQPKVEALNILLLGETGVGKTTFINGLANYLKFETLDGAMDGEPTILVDASFSITGQNNKTKTIVAKANTGVDQETIKLNERLGDKGTSSTQEPVDHLFEWMSEGEKKLVRIIDTPGINDTRGTDQDAKNFEKILKHIAELGELHAVVIVMKPNESKFTVGFRYCLDELLVKLHRSVTKNIVFCFTNTRSTLYRPGDTLSTLHEYLKKVETETGVCIAANRSNIFCYDNDTFRYLCVLRQLPNALTDTTGLSTKKTFSDGWIHNVKESDMMLRRVQGLTAHVVEDMVAIDRARKVVTALARPLGEIARNHVVNMKMIQDKMEEVENLENSGRALDELLSQEQVVLDYVPLAQPRTVCAAPKCVAYVQISELEMFPDYVTICHNPCHMYGVQQNSVMNSALKNCQVFDYMGNCEECGCSWENHMHINYELKYKMAKRVDHETLCQWDLCSNKKQKAELVLSDLQDKLETLEREKDQIRDSCAEFSAFLSMNCMKQTCDPFAAYLRHLSDDEYSKLEKGGGNVDIAVAVCLMHEEYEKRVNHIKEEIKSGRRVALSTRQLNTKIANLSKLKLCGHIIAELMNEQLEVSEENVPEAVKEEPPMNPIEEVNTSLEISQTSDKDTPPSKEEPAKELVEKEEEDTPDAVKQEEPLEIEEVNEHLKISEAPDKNASSPAKEEPAKNLIEEAKEVGSDSKPCEVEDKSDVKPKRRGDKGRKRKGRR